MSVDSKRQFDERYLREIKDNGDDSLSRIARKILPGSLVLDVGTGPGQLARYLTEHMGCVST